MSLAFSALCASAVEAAGPEKTAANVKSSGLPKAGQALKGQDSKAQDPSKKEAAKPSGPPAEGWELQQWHRMAGRIRLVSNKYGGKFETTHYTLLKPVPGERLYFLNQQTKRFVSYDAATWRKKFNFYHKDSGRTKDVGFTDFSPWKRLGEEKIAGLKCVRYSRFRSNKQPAPNDKTYTEEWSFCNALTVPTALIELYKKTLYLNYDARLGFPMRVKEIREWSGKKAKKVDVSYDTLRYSKSSFPQSFFEMGKDYKQVKDEMSVLMDEGGDSMGADGGLGGLNMDEELKRRLK